LAGFVQAISGLKIGADGGTFSAALAAVRKFGGVLEHPAWTRAWAAHGLCDPAPQGGWMREMFGPGWVCSLWQSAYGHRSNKPTWLYYVGVNPPAELNWSRPKGSCLVGRTDKRAGVECLSQRERNATPRAFRDALLELARRSRR
jgi:hypothetical protein